MKENFYYYYHYGMDNTFSEQQRLDAQLHKNIIIKNIHFAFMYGDTNITDISHLLRLTNRIFVTFTFYYIYLLLNVF